MSDCQSKYFPIELYPRLKRGRSRIEIEVEEREEGFEEEGESMAVDDRDLRLTIRGTANGGGNSDRKVNVLWPLLAYRCVNLSYSSN